jgi:hypothetical protein
MRNHAAHAPDFTVELHPQFDKDVVFQVSYKILLSLPSV